MDHKISLALAQLNPVMGDLDGNINRLRQVRKEAWEQGVDLVISSELFICGYPPEDLVLKHSFQEQIRAVVEAFARETIDGGPAVLLGSPWVEKGRLYNAALLLEKGEIAGVVLKNDLPNYGPFDEKRVFSGGPLPTPLTFRGIKLGVMICEDMWTPHPAAHLKLTGADLIVIPNGSPFETDKTLQRHKLATDRVQETGLPLIYVNQLGGQDELVFDGASFALNADGKTLVSIPAWEENVAVVVYQKGQLSLPAEASPELVVRDAAGDIYHALMLGLRDYVNKNGFPGVVLGLSGGIDSALAMALAVDALGSHRVWGVMLPSPYTSHESTEDAEILAGNLGCRLDSVPIVDAMKSFATSLAPLLGERMVGITEENIQSRSRGLILMAISNATGHMVLSTGNKSEMSVGYATLYGDMCGGFAVLKDVYKTEVYNISRWRNRHKPRTSLAPDVKAVAELIPDRILTKAPTAELRPGQTDQDNLPPYEILDHILECLIEKDFGRRDIIASGQDAGVVDKVWGLLDRAEYKRRQAAPGVKITRRNLGRDRRYPITNKYRETK